MGTPASNATRFVRPALRSIVFYLSIIMISSMTMVKSVQAAGTVSVSPNYCLISYFSFGSSCGFSSAAAACVAVGATVQSDGRCKSPNGNYYYYTYGSSGCPANSTGTTTCTCTDPYVPDSTRTSCIPNTCPAHATGTPCACDAGYVFDSAKTSCVPEPYTISLSGLGGDVMPTTTRAAYALVTTTTGSLKSGVQVTLGLTVVPENGDPILASNVGSISPNGGATGADGRLNFVFTAPMAGGLHTITATCVGCSNQATGTIRVSGCLIPPLTALTDRVAIDFDNNVGSRWRPDRLTPAFQEHLACVQREIDAATGVRESYTGTSAYRPEQYQRHLYEIIKKDIELYPDYMTAHPECQALRDEVTGEMGPSPGHDLSYDQPVAIPGTSRHESGTAFDLTPHGLTKAQMAPIYTSCGVTNTKVRKEPWHVQ